MPTKDSNIPKVTPMVVKVTKEARDLTVNDGALTSLLPQGVEHLTWRKIRRREIILDDMEPMCPLRGRHCRIEHGV